MLSTDMVVLLFDCFGIYRMDSVLGCINEVCFKITINLLYCFYLQGTVLKLFGEQEERCYQLLMKDPLAAVVPLFHRLVNC
jgi:hypothetical protein